MVWKTEEIDKRHDRKGFDCGIQELNKFLSTIARQSSQMGITRTHVLVDADAEADPKRILGYYTILPSAIVFPAGHPLQKRFLTEPPVYRLARLAVDNNVKGQGLGAFLLIEALKRIVDASLSVGGIGCAVDAKDADTAGFYEQYGFIPINDDYPLSLWLPMKQCVEVVGIAYPEE